MDEILYGGLPFGWHLTGYLELAIIVCIVCVVAMETAIQIRARRRARLVREEVMRTTRARLANVVRAGQARAGMRELPYHEPRMADRPARDPIIGRDVLRNERREYVRAIQAGNRFVE